MLALLSINLGVLNLHAGPGARRRASRRCSRSRASSAGRSSRARSSSRSRSGVLLLVSLMVFVFYNDIHRLVQG